MSKKTLLTSGKLSKEFKAFIDASFPEINCIHTNEPAKIAKLLPQAQYVAGLNFLQGYPINHLSWIHSFGAGVDSFMKLPIPRDCRLSKTTGKMGKRMGEYCLAFVLEDLKQLQLIHQNQENKNWDIPEQHSLFHHNVYILGTGYVGSEIAMIFQPLSKKVIGINSNGSNVSAFDQCYSMGSMQNTKVPANSIFINTLPLTSETSGLLDKHFFQNLSACTLLNVGRGATINEKDLIVALSNNNIKKAILDVFDKEPLPQDSSLWHHPKCIVTPHLAGPTRIEDIADSFTIAYKSIKDGTGCSLFIEKKRGY